MDENKPGTDSDAEKELAGGKIMKSKRLEGRNITYLLFVLPMLVLFFMFNTFPLIRAFIYSLTNSRGFGSYEWIGIRNYVDLFTDSRIWNSYLFTFKFAIAATVIVNVLSMVMALLLNSKIRAKGFFRGLYFLPNILGGLVIAYVFNFFFTFILPGIGKSMGIDFLSTSLLSRENTAWFAVVICAAWQAIAFNTIIYISGLQTIPEDVFEAASIDGATKWKKFWKISFPLIAPFFTINMVLCMKNFLMVFDQIIAMTGGGPNQSTESISLLIYKAGLSGSQFGYQSANSVVYFIIIVLISVFQMKVLNKREVQL